MPKVEPVAVAILAKAPIPGFAKTRLVPPLDPAAAALLQARLVERALATACGAGTGPVTLWGTPDESYFRQLALRFPVRLARQPAGDLGCRMLAAFEAECPLIVIGTDCPALEARHLHQAADLLRHGADAVLIPAEDGGYVLIGLRRPYSALFASVDWGTSSVMAQTRRRAAELDLPLGELPSLWDVDVPEDLERMRRAGFAELVPAMPQFPSPGNGPGESSG